MTTTHEELQKRAAAVSLARDALAAIQREMNSELAAVTRRHEPYLRKACRALAAGENRMRELIASTPALFVKPRTHVVDGVKYGLQKAKGKMTWSDDAQLCGRIDKLVDEGTLSDEQRGLLIVTTEKPVAKALEQLDAKVLKRLGVTVSADSDEVVLKSVDSAIDKAIATLLKDLAKDVDVEVLA